VPVYYKVISSKSPRFQGRTVCIFSPTDGTLISVPDTVVLCGGCNKNMYPEDVYAVYLGKRDLREDIIYDVYCGLCLERLFPKAKNV